MRFVRFQIKNFKGIQNASLDLTPSGSNVFTLIGLNESGKTTILEAIDDFGASREGMEALYGAKRVAEFVTYVPKHLKANFTGEITVAALVKFEDGELEDVIHHVAKATGCKLDRTSIPSEFVITRGYKFENSDYKSKIYLWGLLLKGKEKGGRGIKDIALSSESGRSFVNAVNSRLPKIVYFPTFLFSIPSKIILNPNEDEESAENRLYRQIIQDVASSLSSPLDIKTHIVDRMLSEPSLTDQIFNLMMLAPDKQQQINATLNLLSQHLTRTVFESWGKIFSGNFRGREISVRLGTDKDGDNRSVYLKFVLKDGATEYDVAERSLGFRWFFSFLLFTLYRVYAKGSRGPTLFLLDEPASNLHSRAQMQLLESFRRIAGRSSGIMYSTHSHYMINPEWLDQAFVVANSAIDYDNPGEEILEDNPSTEVSVARYRAFVGQNPSKTTYFQPVLDKLEVVPSRLELLRPSVLVEGKGDYFMLEYGRRVLLSSTSDVAIVPTRGAADMDDLIGLFYGWNVDFVICLDDDKAGRTAKDSYISEWALSSQRVFTLKDLDPTLSDGRIEDFLTPEDRDLVAKKIGVNNPSKSQIQLFFSEALATRTTYPLSDTFISRVSALEEKAHSVLSPGSSTLNTAKRRKNPA
jgi:ABC-type Mn2+/Zn2+ transport system ATPase subunit